jgi:hypothetical protein
MSSNQPNNLDPDQKRSTAKSGKIRWWQTLLFTVAYFIPLFYLWARIDFPASLGVHITAHGTTGLLENWYYSYLLLQRHRPLDLISFCYMWVIVIGPIGWLLSKRFRHPKIAVDSDSD